MTQRPPTHQTTRPNPPRRSAAVPDLITPSEPILSPGAQRILVVDGDHRVRDSLADLIDLAEGVTVVGTCSQPGETLAAIKRLDPDVVVIDPYLPDLDAGLALIRTLRARRRVIRIVATCRDDGLGPLALAAGADACVDRCADPSAFQEAVIAAACPEEAQTGHAAGPGHPGHAPDNGAATQGAGSGGIL